MLHSLAWERLHALFCSFPHANVQVCVTAIQGDQRETCYIMLQQKGVQAHVQNVCIGMSITGNDGLHRRL